MKKCKYCGTIVKENDSICAYCGEHLVIPEQDHTLKSDQTSRMLDKMDDFYLTPGDKVSSILQASGILTSIFMLIKSYPSELLIAIIILGVAFINNIFPKLLWEIEKLRLSFTMNDAEKATPSPIYLLGRKLNCYISLVIGYYIIISSLFKVI